MSFYVQKSLAHGPIRFGVNPRQTLDEIDTDPSLSTGPAGEFLRRRTFGFFFADIRPIGAPDLASSTPRSPSLWASLVPEDRRGWIFIGMMILGVILVLLGLSVVVNKGPQGWIEVILGIGLAATPLVVTAQKRRVIRAEEERQRAEREERERRNREAIASYATALERLRENTNDETLAAATRERQQLEVSHRVWRPLAKRTVLHIGFDALARLTTDRAPEVAKLMNRVANAIGLDRADATDVKADLYQVIVWHLLADDRLGTVQSEQLRKLEADFGISGRDLSAEREAVDEFDRLRGITREDLPRADGGIPLGFREQCIHVGQGKVISRAGSESSPLYLTNKRLIIGGGRRRIEVPLSRIDDVDVDVDANTLTLRLVQPAKPIVLQVEQPIYTAALIDIATTIDDRPRSFA